jgi:hypothetical protein
MTRGPATKKVGILEPLFRKEGRGEIFLKIFLPKNPPYSPFAKGGVSRISF